MKKLIGALILIALICVAMMLASAETGFIDLTGRWEDPESERALLKIMRTFEMDVPDDEIWYDVELTWSQSKDAETVWYMAAKFDDETRSLVYTDGVKAEVTYDEKGNIASEQKLWEDSEGALIPIDGKLQWADRREDQLRTEAGEDNMIFQRVSRSAPSAEEFRSEYFMAVANVEESSAGSSLKQAETARDIVRFALRNNLWDTDFKGMRRNMLSAWEKMSADEQSTFDSNLQEIFMPMLESAFGDYAQVSGSFEDAGIGEDMAWLSENREAKASWQTLLGNTMTLGNDDDMFAYVEAGRLIVEIAAPAYGDGAWTAKMDEETVVHLASEKVENSYYTAIYEPLVDGTVEIHIRHMNGDACLETYSMELTVRDGAIQDPPRADYTTAEAD